MARFRSTHSKGNSYLQLVESYRNDQNQPSTRVLANLGNISNLPPEKIERLTESFILSLTVQAKKNKKIGGNAPKIEQRFFKISKSVDTTCLLTISLKNLILYTY